MVPVPVLRGHRKATVPFDSMLMQQSK